MVRKQKTSTRPDRVVHRYRSIWISDVHLGTSNCKAGRLVDFLKHHECGRLYLVGNIIDGRRLKRGWFWPQEHTNVIRNVLTKAKRGTGVFYVTGDRDDFLRKFVDYRLEIGNIHLVNEVVHETVDGRRLLVLHGDFFETVTRFHHWIARTADVVDAGIGESTRWLNRARAGVGLSARPPSPSVRRKIETVARLIPTFGDAVARECRRRGLDGVICGHSRSAEVRDVHGVTYYNCGDWIDSCSALAEDFNGRISIIRWTEAAFVDRPIAAVSSVRV